MSEQIQLERPVSTRSPVAFLRLGAGQARGFWARGDAWVAHVDVVAEVQAVGEGRFAEVDRAGHELFTRVRPDHHTRLYGGFSFLADHRPEGAWSAFPSSRFILPRVELEYVPEEGQTVLRVRGERTDVVAQQLERWADRLDRAPASAPTEVPGTREMGPRVTGLEREDWSETIRGALEWFEQGRASKIVVARSLHIEGGRRVDPLDVAMAMHEENRGSHVFYFEPSPGHALVGAAPETIATLGDGVLRATAGAGSVGVGDTSVETAALARQLFESRKDRAEQRFVVDDVVTRLQDLGCTVRVDVEPHVLTLAQIQHLETKIAADVPEGLGVLDLLASLHPTPAVCGSPRDAALEFLASRESFARGWYAGPVGWFDQRGHGVFVPALRSAVHSEELWRLFAGAGIVAGSDPDLEWIETGLKFKPVLRALVRAGLSPEVLERAA